MKTRETCQPEAVVPLQMYNPFSDQELDSPVGAEAVLSAAELGEPQLGTSAAEVLDHAQSPLPIPISSPAVDNSLPIQP